MADLIDPMPDWMLERVALGELPPDELEMARRRIDADPEARARLDEIVASTCKDLRKYPPKQIGRFIAARRLLESAPPDEEARVRAPPLPPRLVRRAARRLWAVSSVIGGFFLVGFVIHAVVPEYVGWSGTSVGVALATDATVVLASVALLAAIRSRRFAPTILLGAAQIYEVVVCFSVSLFEAALARDLEVPAPGLSFVCVLIVLFPMFVASTGRTAVLVALAAATTGPLAAAVLAWSASDPTPSLAELGGRYLFNYVTVLLAGIPIAMIRGHGRDEHRARKLGSYELGARLGSGGMGEVWRANHHTLRRPAAIKLIRPESLGTGSIDRALRRFEREAQATAELHSPHSIQVYDFGTAEDGRFFYVMELLDGFDLHALVEKFGPQPPARVVHILIQACDSLWDAHCSGLIHRDIKPANIYVCRYGHEVDFVKVLDFGMVKTHEADLTLTRGGNVPGTPAYLAPEIALGEEEIDGRADLYSLGCVAYWLLTGQLVFEETTPLQMAMAHVRDAPELPSTRTELDIPQALEQVVISCLAKRPDDRPADARALAEALARSLYRNDWGAAQAQRWWQTNRPAGAAP